MARARKRKTEIQKQYDREYNRLKRAVKRAEERGYFFDKNPLPKKLTRPSKKSVSNLKAIKPEQIYNQARVYFEDTGEIISGKEARSLERKAAAQRAAESRKRNREIKEVVKQTLPKMEDMIINQFRIQISRFPESAEPVLTPWLDNLIETRGKHAVAVMLEDARANGIVIDHKVAYSQMIYTFMADLLEYLPMSEQEKQELTDAFEEVEDWETPF